MCGYFLIANKVEGVVTRPYLQKMRILTVEDIEQAAATHTKVMDDGDWDCMLEHQPQEEPMVEWPELLHINVANRPGLHHCQGLTQSQADLAPEDDVRLEDEDVQVPDLIDDEAQEDNTYDRPGGMVDVD